jgi:tRNA (adenine22-N1)-methyltransferase
MKRYKQLDKRLSALAELVRDGATVCDIGTDHAYLPCYLSRKGNCGRLFAVDLNPKPLEFARSQIEKQNADVMLLQSDGLLQVPPPNVNELVDVIIAGMGGELIAEIIAKIPTAFLLSDLRLILQPMTRAGHLRQGLSDCGFTIIHETQINERKRTFTIIYAERGVFKKGECYECT